MAWGGRGGEVIWTGEGGDGEVIWTGGGGVVRLYGLGREGW